MFGLNNEELSSVLEACQFLLEQFAYNTTKPDHVVPALSKAGFSDEHVRVDVRSKWSPSPSSH
jgi:hypothetical protein